MTKPKYHLAYTRDTGLIVQQAWAFGLKNIYKKLLGYEPQYPLVIDFAVDNTIEIYQHKRLISDLEKAILNKNKKDKDFFFKNFNKFKSDLNYFQDLWGNGLIDSPDSFKEVIKRLNIWVENYILYYHTATNNQSPKAILEITRNFRQTDDYWSKAANYFRKSLINLYPGIRGIEDVVLQSEVSLTPIIETLKKRKNGFVVVGKKSFIGSIHKLPYTFDMQPKKTNLIKGQIAFKGKIKGRVFILKSIINNNKIKKGDVLVSPMTTPDMMMAINKCSAIVTDEGGITCHAAIVARELKKPCIIGTKIATKVLKDGDLVEVDANSGTVKILKRA